MMEYWKNGIMIQKKNTEDRRQHTGEREGNIGRMERLLYFSVVLCGPCGLCERLIIVCG
jgi:hypothetical protein